MDANSDVVSTWRFIITRVTPQATKDQEKYWKAWQSYAATWNIGHFLQDYEKIYIIIVITYFSAWFRKGYYGKGFKIKIPTVTKALSAISTSTHLVGKFCPFKNA